MAAFKTQFSLAARHLLWSHSRRCHSALVHFSSSLTRCKEDELPLRADLSHGGLDDSVVVTIIFPATEERVREFGGWRDLGTINYFNTSFFFFSFFFCSWVRLSPRKLNKNLIKISGPTKEHPYPFFVRKKKKKINHTGKVRQGISLYPVNGFCCEHVNICSSFLYPII